MLRIQKQITFPENWCLKGYQKDTLDVIGSQFEMEGSVSSLGHQLNLKQHEVVMEPIIVVW